MPPFDTPAAAFSSRLSRRSIARAPDAESFLKNDSANRTERLQHASFVERNPRTAVKSVLIRLFVQYHASITPAYRPQWP
jgi:hypothetical protein